MLTLFFYAVLIAVFSTDIHVTPYSELTALNAFGIVVCGVFFLIHVNTLRDEYHARNRFVP